MMHSTEQNTRIAGDLPSDGPVRPIAARTVPEVFGEQARRHPDRLAVADDQGRTLTYADLDRRSDAIAAHLLALGVRPEDRCAVVHERSIDVVVAMLGTLKAGGAYVCVDPSLPVKRMAVVLDDAGVDVVLTSSHLVAGLPGEGRHTVALDELADAGEPVRLPEVRLSPRHLAYVIYTSGSTGTPKGVLVEHGSLVHFVEMVREFFELSEQDRILHAAALWFDVSVFEVFGALLVGASVHIAGDQTKMTPGALQHLMRENGVTTIMTTPSLLEVLDPDALPDLRVMSIGGEPFSGELTNRWSPGRRFINGYGPAEATVEVVAKVCTGQWETSPPIGLPLANHRAYALDERMRPVPVGVTGELYVGGPGVARGYLAQPALTASLFLPDPMGRTPGDRLYRTGDLVQWLESGDLRYVGRVDRQVKVRGMRVELGEVEQVIARHPDVSRAVAVCTPDGTGDARLTGYIVADNGATPDDVRSFTAAWLPAYMVPSEIVLVPAIPTTASGKVDIVALTAAVAPAPSAPPAAAGDRTPTQQAVAEIVEEILGVAGARVDEDLFALGGNSLQVLRVLSRVRSSFGVVLTPQEFFENPTIAGIATAIDAQPANA